MSKQSKKEENVEWVCPFCRHKNIAPSTTGVPRKCAACGKEWGTSGIDVDNKELFKLSDEFQKRRRREIEADKERE